VEKNQAVIPEKGPKDLPSRKQQRSRFLLVRGPIPECVAEGNAGLPGKREKKKVDGGANRDTFAVKVG